MDDAFVYGRLLADLEAIRNMLASAGLARASEEVRRAICVFWWTCTDRVPGGESHCSVEGRVLDESNLRRLVGENERGRPAADLQKATT
jgi:hypothetical protein